MLELLIFVSGWMIGELDFIIMMDEEVVVVFEGDLLYYDYIVDLGFMEDVWVKVV